MTNTHINVGGHKITTNKVGQVHYVTSGFINGYTGTLRWCVTNGICVIATDGWGRSSGDGRIIGYTGLPPAKMPCFSQVGDNYGNLGIDTQGNLSVYQGSGNLVQLWHELVYPVADDWVES